MLRLDMSMTLALSVRDSLTNCVKRDEYCI
jgi:hypothetical protein